MNRGIVYASAAYLLWGVFPIYFKALQQIAPLEILGHRIVWSLAVCAALLLALRRLLGKPSERVQFKLKQEEVWSWRHVDAMKQQKLFNAHLDLDGRVKSTSVSDDAAQPFKGG